MLNAEFAHSYAKHWVEAWNSRDINSILSHYHDDFVMSSPKIATIAGEPSGVLRGKSAVAAYWTKALSLIPQLNFVLADVFIGADSLILHYHSFSGPVTEVFFFNEQGLVVKAAAHYLATA
ncbi:MAG TPA: nuclear transport factor 2 family protein [Cellvibrionaceae bacterium]|nr:nuclear transport factor 2 family protein [Cellvibrionaceae bacterium]HMW48368.1 nuclear transport factor 2 family protein [Cellvibrionaceae bacterium]HMW72756.1 nuclear transport factor 2 family protein [Cellvibrionaceae bacterium]HMY41031.1 nuclear transport factor 2 family protein [Marinagarivorans sp.]HNG59302.1 nuclear transport factor 2 family protein [Cellvibrionaceae bacterium]